MKIEEVVGANIAERREDLGLSQGDLGELLGKYLEKPWPRQAVSAAEKGRRAFAVAELVALALALRVEIAELLLPRVAEGGERRVELPGGPVPLTSYLPLVEGADQDQLVRQADVKTLKILIPHLKTQSWVSNALYQTLRDIYLEPEVREQDIAEEQRLRTQTAEIIALGEDLRSGLAEIRERADQLGSADPENDE